MLPKIIYKKQCDCLIPTLKKGLSAHRNNLGPPLLSLYSLPPNPGKTDRALPPSKTILDFPQGRVYYCNQ